MKIIALLPVKNEEWILNTTIPQLKLFVDEILCLDGGSTDTTVSKLTSYGVHVRMQNQKILNYSSWRQELLDWARERGATHLVWLDSDEAFTTNFLSGSGKISFRERLSKMVPGEKLSMQWLCLWKSPFVYRDDTSVWSNHYKDFIVCDKFDPQHPHDPKYSLTFGTEAFHEGRTPGPNNIQGKSTATRVALDEGAVLHFQFVAFRRYQIKQVYIHCREYISSTASARRLNNKYSVTLDDPHAQTTPIPNEWLIGLNNLELIEKNNNTITENYYFKEVMNFFSEKGVAYFEPLDIWHIPELKRIFIEKYHRNPKPSKYPNLLILLNRFKNKILHSLHVA